MFYDGEKTSELGSRSHVLKHLYGRMVFGSFEKKNLEVNVWRGQRLVISIV